METFIVLMALAAAAGGTLVLLSGLAHRRAQLVKAFNYLQEMEAHKQQADQGRTPKAANKQIQQNQPAVSEPA